MVKVKKDLTGKIFGKLTVIKQVEDYISPQGKPYAKWLCKCECGNEKEFVGRSLISKNTQSCGCGKKNLSGFVKTKEDLTGQKFGRLTVIKQAKDYIKPNGIHQTKWLCKCECGNEKEIATSSLKSGATKSCGCLCLNSTNFVKTKEDLTGRVFGKLTVIKQVEDLIDSQGHHLSQWLCECECAEHNKKIVKGKSLLNGDTRSCGCLKKKKLSSDPKTKLNLKDSFGYYGIGYTSNTNKEFYFDMEDYEKIKNYAWYEHHSRNYRRLLTVVKKDDTYKNYSMAQVILGNWYDHIDRNPFNNRKNNLRKCLQLHQDNNKNRSKYNNNTSGFIGIYYLKNAKKNKWQAIININKEQIN